MIDKFDERDEENIGDTITRQLAIIAILLGAVLFANMAYHMFGDIFK